MSLLSAFKPRATAARPGRHTPLSIIERLTGERDAAVKLARDLTAERDGLRAELEQARELHADDAVEWEAALDFTSREYAQLQDECERLTRDNEALHKFLGTADGGPGTAPTVAPLDDPQSCFSQPSPPPAGDEPRIVADTPVAPASYEIADINAETLAVDVADLRAGAEATQQLDVTALRNATGLGATAVLPVVALEPARHPRPEPWPPARPTSARTLSDAFGAADLKQQVTPDALPGGGFAVRLAKTAALLP